MPIAPVIVPITNPPQVVESSTTMHTDATSEENLEANDVPDENTNETEVPGQNTAETDSQADSAEASLQSGLQSGLRSSSDRPSVSERACAQCAEVRLGGKEGDDDVQHLVREVTDAVEARLRLLWFWLDSPPLVFVSSSI
jgi:hypothetical protein